MHRWRRATGNVEVLAQGLDYPQFPAIVDGSLFVPLARHNLVVRLDIGGGPPPFVPLADAPAGLNVSVANGAWGPLTEGEGAGGDGEGAAGGDREGAAGLTLALQCEGALRISGPLTLAGGAAALGAWVRVPTEMLPGIDAGRMKDGYPGFVREFALPRCTCAVAAGGAAPTAAPPCGVLVEAEHAHGAARWPMLAGYRAGDPRYVGRSFAAGASGGAAAFGEAPRAFLVFVSVGGG